MPSWVAYPAIYPATKPLGGRALHPHCTEEKAEVSGALLHLDPAVASGPMSLTEAHVAGSWQGRMVPRHPEAAPRWLSSPAGPFLETGGGGLLGQRALECSSSRFLRCELPSRNYSACPHPAGLPLCGPQPHHFPHRRWECGRPGPWPALVASCLHCGMGNRCLFFHKKKDLGLHLLAEPLQHPAPK